MKNTNTLPEGVKEVTINNKEVTLVKGIVIGERMKEIKRKGVVIDRVYDYIIAIGINDLLSKIYQYIYSTRDKQELVFGQKVVIADTIEELSEEEFEQITNF